VTCLEQLFEQGGIEAVDPLCWSPRGEGRDPCYVARSRGGRPVRPPETIDKAAATGQKHQAGQSPTLRRISRKWAYRFQRLGSPSRRTRDAERV
jgi:hypothetical protein